MTLTTFPTQGVDIIGDIHGQADKLIALLEKLGYRDVLGAYRHPDRTAIFVGDLVDRGPRQVDTVMLVRRMVDAGSARIIMGNHEYNAIAWHTPDPERAGEYLRPRSGAVGVKNRHQHAAFLAEVEHRPALHQELIDWFMTIPLWLEAPGFRVVHACWHDGYMNEIRPLLTADLQLTPELVVAASRKGSAAYRAVEGVTKGLELALPDGHFFHDKDGVARYEVRTRWWDESALTYRALAMMPETERLALPELAVAVGDLHRYAGEKPVFFGHYWMTGTPALQTPMAACVDYSAGKGGDLVAYRWDGEAVLDGGKFFVV
ncbi:metallophosphoesterase [Pigmentiphaga aceris]|uniref:Metallophosphoesterase n=1 Tax=Pigmentiphaga aceris TaxID=1940612 RepID=A0A5C0B5F4_9BURK|nr:metallophosphoesterase [Pigmentiphaga aceris]QEI08913.1 metallophosphoesterase [Pigmentiphaga aceris]